MPGASIGVISDTANMWGMIWNKRVEEMGVVLTSAVKAKRPEVIITLDEQVAAKLLQQSTEEEVLQFLQSRSREGDIEIFNLQDSARLDSLGVQRFLRALGLQAI